VDVEPAARSLERWACTTADFRPVKPSNGQLGTGLERAAFRIAVGGFESAPLQPRIRHSERWAFNETFEAGASS
jgi:hypothetical protein